ncbi:hypothetical protein V8E54_011562 [Elaphomyces granulatus]
MQNPLDRDDVYKLFNGLHMAIQRAKSCETKSRIACKPPLTEDTTPRRKQERLDQIERAILELKPKPALPPASNQELITKIRKELPKEAAKEDIGIQKRYDRIKSLNTLMEQDAGTVTTAKNQNDQYRKRPVKQRECLWPLYCQARHQRVLADDRAKCADCEKVGHKPWDATKYECARPPATKYTLLLSVTISSSMPILQFPQQRLSGLNVRYRQYRVLVKLMLGQSDGEGSDGEESDGGEERDGEEGHEEGGLMLDELPDADQGN